MNEHIQLFKESLGVLAKYSRFVALYLAVMALVTLVAGMKNKLVLLVFPLSIMLVYTMGGVLGCLKASVQCENMCSLRDIHLYGKKYFLRISGILLLVTVVPILMATIYDLHEGLNTGGILIMAAFWGDFISLPFIIGATSLVVYYDQRWVMSLRHSIGIIRRNWFLIIIAIVMAQMNLFGHLLFERNRGIEFAYGVAAAMLNELATVTVYTMMFLKFRKREYSDIS